MLNRYLGNKQSIMTPLLASVAEYAQPGDHVADVFSGSLSVSMGLKNAGYQVTSNDVNLFSAVLADAYLVPTSTAPTDAAALVSASELDAMRAEARTQAESLRDSTGFHFLESVQMRAQYVEFLAVLNYLAEVDYDDLPAAHRRSDFYDAYCEDGAHSAFVSTRGTTGNRRFFSPGNARRIDLILNTIRWWKQEDRLDPHTYALLLSTLLRGVEKVSNTQGTYHDFPRTTWDSRALQTLTLIPPAMDAVVAGIGGHSAGREQDSLNFVSSIDKHKLLYLDPPYNFRQYSAYYFMPNVICRYPEIEDLDDYFGKLRYVRGQNPEDDFVSTFCKPSHFIQDLTTLIARADCDTVMISYFTGKNHWSGFESSTNDVGQVMLSAMLTSDAFVPGSFTVKEVPRKNYASYGGFKARNINELILVARVRQAEDHANTTSGRTEHGLQTVA